MAWIIASGVEGDEPETLVGPFGTKEDAEAYLVENEAAFIDWERTAGIRSEQKFPASDTWIWFLNSPADLLESTEKEGATV